jgi:membrane protein YdbS with pleckstrin-like domain
LSEASDSELARVIWFWCRRPKLKFHDSAALVIVALCLLISLSIALVSWPETSLRKRIDEVIVVLFEFVAAVYVIGHRLRFLRWRREYERSIDRLIQSLHPGV